jgi:hypothetical protein
MNKSLLVGSVISVSIVESNAKIIVGNTVFETDLYEPLSKVLVLSLFSRAHAI